MAVDPIELAVPGVRGLNPYEPGKPIDSVLREYGVSEAVKLALNYFHKNKDAILKEATQAEGGK